MLKYKGYFGRVDYDPDAKILHGEVMGLRDVITFQADSVAGIEKAFRESVDDYLAFCRSRGESPERPASGQFVVRAGAKLHRDLTTLARVTGTSLNALVVEFLKRQVERSVSEGDSVRPSRRRKSA